MASDSLLIKQAIESCQLGEFSQAAGICHELIKADSNNYKALHVLGVVLHKAGLYDQALDVLKKALALVGPQTSILFNYGLALRGAKKFEAAALVFREVVKLSPDRIDSWYSLGEVEHQSNRLNRAIEAFKKVLELDPDNLEARIYLGVALRRMGQPEDARTYVEEIIKVDPKNVAAQNNIGIIETELGNLSSAKIAFQTALSVQPNYSDAHYNIGNVYWIQMQFHFAAEHFERAFQLDENNHLAQYQLALCLQKLKFYDKALKIINKLINDYGKDPLEKARFLNGRANIYRDLGRFNNAFSDIEEAIAIFPKNPKFLGNKALTLLHAGHLEDAITNYKKAQMIDPRDGEVNSHLAHALLLGGHYEEGWLEFEDRLNSPTIISKQNTMPGDIWCGEDLKDKHLLVWCEQGLGDTIQFLRFISLIVNKAKKITILCPDRLKLLLDSFVETVTVLGQSSTLPNADFNAPLMSLPFLLGINKIFDPGPYLSAKDSLVVKWHNVIENSEKPKIGISWQGNPAYEVDYQRSIPLSCLHPLILQKKYIFISLQRGFGHEQMINFSNDILDLGEHVDKFGAFTDTAAIISNLDIVITSDTAIAHLAGALGVKVWVLLPVIPDWRWLLGREDSPWYSSMRLFRQKEAGRWNNVVEQVITALSEIEFG